MKVYQPETIATLRFIAQQDYVTNRELAERLRVSIDTAKRRMNNLHHQGFIESHGYTRGTSVKYSVTAKGLSFLRSVDRQPEVGNFPAPREPISQERYIPKPINTRPGSEAFLAIPSRRGAELVPHALPMSMAGGGA